MNSVPSSVSDPDPLGSAFNWSPGSGLKRAKIKKKTQLKDKKYKNQCNWYKNVYCDLIFIKI
jgi:hypothetical protein